jgi:hypothetical protein
MLLEGLYRRRFAAGQVVIVTVVSVKFPYISI